MAAGAADVEDPPPGATELVAEVARSMRANIAVLAGAMQAEDAEAIPELRGDPAILELLFASIESNIETMLHFAQGSISIDEIEPPTAASAYARRLAQRGTSSNALLRAYRLGQRHFVTVALSEISQADASREVALAAAQIMHEIASVYIDRVAERVVADYETERELWLANRNTVRAAVLSAVLRGDSVELSAGESALGYRLRQNHIGLVLWDTDRTTTSGSLRRLESLLASVGEAIGGASQPLFMPQDTAVGWGWIPVGWSAGAVDASAIRKIEEAAGATLRVALGTSGTAMEGFRATHLEAMRAYSVATIANGRAGRVTSYGEPGVAAAALLAADLSSTRELVASALGGLAADDETVERLRETLLEFLSQDGSYQTTAELIHVHRNTVRYRVAKALEARGRPLDDDRFNLQLALVACRWLGEAVLTP